MNTLLEPPTTETKILERKSMATRVELHPFLVGMNREELALLTDCAMPSKSTKANRYRYARWRRRLARVYFTFVRSFANLRA
jgi:hypothetical protein